MEFVQVVSVENMRKSDARTIAEHTPSAELMYRAARLFKGRPLLL